MRIFYVYTEGYANVILICKALNINDLHHQ